MKYISIDSPCKEDWAKMSPTQQGAFCQKCEIDVIDFSKKTPEQVRSILEQNQGKHMCGRFETEQLKSLNIAARQWNKRSYRIFQSRFVYALMLVFGMSLFSCDRQESELLADLDRQKNELLSEEPNTVADQIAQTIQAENSVFVEKAPKIEEFVLPPEDIILGGLETHDYYEESGELALPTVERTLVTIGSICYTSIAEVIPEEVDTAEQDLLPEEILNEVNPFETQLFPNPTRDISTLVVSVQKEAQFEIQLYTMSGQLIRQIHSGELMEGEQRFELELYDQPSGMYLITVISEEKRETHKVQKL